MRFYPTTRERLVGPEGNPAAKVCLVGEKPAGEEVKLGRPFVGRAGGVLDQCLATAAMMRHSVYLTNVVKEYGGTPHIDPWFDANTMRFTELGAPWRDSLREELKGVRANVIVPLGNTALAAVCGEGYKPKINTIRGYVVETLDGRKCIPTIHPASVLYGGGQRKKTGSVEERTSPYIQRYYIANDLRKAKTESSYPEIRRPVREILIPDSLDNALQWIDFFHTCPRLSIDIEVVNFEVSTIGVADSPQRAMSFPFYHSVWDELEETQLWLAMAHLLGNRKIVKVFQNGIFDVHFLLTRCGIVVEPITPEMYEDTMMAHSVMYPEMLKGLNFLVSMYCGSQEYYKGMINFKNIKEGA